MLTLRPTQLTDCEQLWHWVNDADVRASAFSSSPIAWEDHRQWLSRKLHDPQCYMFIAQTSEGTAIGQIRFDCSDDQNAEIDISLDKNQRGFRHGIILLQKGIEKLFEETKIQRVHAYIKSENVASIKLFERADFQKVGIEIVKEFEALHYQKERRIAN